MIVTPNLAPDKDGSGGDLKITLVSPGGTMSTVLNRSSRNMVQQAAIPNWPLMSTHFWGENPVGRWQLIIENKLGGSPVFQGWSLKIYGTELQPGSVPVKSLVKAAIFSFIFSQRTSKWKSLM